MAAKPDRNAANRNAGPRWKPPMWLLVADVLSMAVLAAGLMLQFAPDSPAAQALPPEAKLPLLAVGGTGFAVCWVALALSAIRAQRSR